SVEPSFRFSVRARLGRAESQPAANAFAGISADGIQVGRLRVGRDPGWIGRLSGRLPIWIRQPRDSFLALFGDGVDDADSWRSRTAVRGDSRRLRLRPAPGADEQPGTARHRGETLATRNGCGDRADRSSAAQRLGRHLRFTCPHPDRAAWRMSERGLRALGLTKVFGGLTAVNNVSIQLTTGVVHAVIGPNGAGKTTLINMLSGDLAPSAGSIHFDGRDMVGYSSDRLSRIGIGRTYQKINVFPSFTAFENCRLAAQSRDPHPLSLLGSIGAYPSLAREAERALAAVGLQQRAQAVAGTLSHGEQRQLDIAMSLATRPQVLLLDEPLSGMGAEESVKMVRLL